MNREFYSTSKTGSGFDTRRSIHKATTQDALLVTSARELQNAVNHTSLCTPQAVSPPRKSPPRRSLFPLVLFLPDTESMFQQIHLLLHMRALQARRHTGAGIPPRIEDVLAIMMYGLIEQGLDAGLDETPRAGIKRLFLAPDDVLGVGVGVEVLAQLGPGEGVELLDAGDGGVVVLFGRAVLV